MYCRGSSMHNDLSKQEKRHYAMQYLISCLYEVRDWPRLFSALDRPDYIQRKLSYDPSGNACSKDLELGRQAAAQQKGTWPEELLYLPHLWRYTFLQQSLTMSAQTYIDLAFRILCTLGRQK